MDTSLTVRNMRRESWADMLHEQAVSGLTVREWCKQNNLSVKSFYYRRRQVQTMVLDAAQNRTQVLCHLPERNQKEMMSNGELREAKTAS